MCNNSTCPAAKSCRRNPAAGTPVGYWQAWGLWPVPANISEALLCAGFEPAREEQEQAHAHTP